MPELPEVETTRRGIAPYLAGKILKGAVVRHPRLRWPIPERLNELLGGRRVEQVLRRGKYLLLDCGNGWLIIHLGMSGSLRIVRAASLPEKHDHLDICIDNGDALRMRDPRRFGAVLWEPGNVWDHPLIKDLGPEPLESDTDPDRLYDSSRGRTAAIKQVLMDSHTLVGVGNIYANEALFRAGIRPDRPAGQVSREECRLLLQKVRDTLTEAIAAGGSTLKDFVDTAGKPGYFQQSYFVYGRANEACRQCGALIEVTRLGQRATYRCPHCQP